MQSFLAVILYAIAISAISEGINYYFVYSSKKFQDARRQADKLAAQVERMKEKNAKEKMIAPLERDLVEMQRKATGIQVRGTIASTVIVIAAFSGISRMLPFEPFSLVRSLSHRGLAGEDYREMSATFVYVLANIVVRHITSQITGEKAKIAGPSIWEQATKVASKWE
ncbi:Calcium load-activated calcium channel [Sorochytrium milnesiophthora]